MENLKYETYIKRFRTQTDVFYLTSHETFIKMDYIQGYKVNL